MASELFSFGQTQPGRIELKSYNVTIPMGSIAIGVDNIHHDVFLSPKFVQASHAYLYDLLQQNSVATYFPGIDLRSVKALDTSAYRKLLTELLQNSLTLAKHQKNIEIDYLFRLALLKFLTQELGNQFGNLILEGKEWIRKRGEYFERGQEAHVIKARLSELQAAKRNVLRGIGQQVHQMLADIEDNILAKTRRALFGEDFAPVYELLKNRIIFLDGGKDEIFFLEHYVLLGNYVRDPDRFEAMDALFQEFVREAGIAVAHDPAHDEVRQAHAALLEQAERVRQEIARLEEQREALQKKLERGDGLLARFMSSAVPADLRASVNDVKKRLSHQHAKLEELGPQIDEAKHKLDFFHKDYAGRLGDYLDEPENARRMFDASAAEKDEAPLRVALPLQALQGGAQCGHAGHVQRHQQRDLAPACQAGLPHLQGGHCRAVERVVAIAPSRVRQGARQLALVQAAPVAQPQPALGRDEQAGRDQAAVSMSAAAAQRHCPGSRSAGNCSAPKALRCSVSTRLPTAASMRLTWW